MTYIGSIKTNETMTYNEIREILSKRPDCGREWAIYEFISLATKPNDILWIGGYAQDFDKVKREWYDYVEAYNANGDDIRIIPSETQLCVKLYGALPITTKEQLQKAWSNIDLIYHELKQKGEILKTSPLWTKIVEC